MRLMFIVMAGISLAVSTAASEPIPTSRSGIVLFTLPVDRQRVEEAGYTALKPFRPDSYEIRIRPAFDISSSVADAVEMHARWMATAYAVQPATMPSAFHHPAGFDVALRTFYLRGADGRVASVLVAVLKGGTKAAVIEFVSATPQSPLAIEQMVRFIDGCRLAHTQVVVSGNPPLTVYDVEETIDVLQWLIDAPLVVATRAAIRTQIIDDWKAKDASTIAEVRRILEFRDQVIKLPPAQQNLVRRQNETDLVAGLRTEKNRASAVLLESYESAHPPIAAGTPALTRQQADAAIDLFYFMAGQLEGVQAAPTEAAKTAWAGNLARSWATLPLETRKAVAAMPVTWALTLAVWPQMAPTVREQVKWTYAQMDVVKTLRSDFAIARAQASASQQWYPPAPQQPASGVMAGPGPAGFNGFAAAPTRPQDSSGVDVSQQISRMNQNYQATSSMLTSQYNSTISMMAAIGNMSGSRYTVR
jgi:hypothetical protein